MAIPHDIVRALAPLVSRPTEITLGALAALNVLCLFANLLFFVRNHRRMRRVKAREGRLVPGPVTAAVGSFTRLGAKEPSLSAPGGRAGE